MKCYFIIGFLLLATLRLSAAILYVSVSSPNPAPPYASWATAATNIQDAVDAAANADTILVTNGIYRFGGRAVSTNLLVNRVAIDKPIEVASVNGPGVSIIQGYQVPGTITGDGAIRCVYLTNGAALNGFTLTGGATRNFGDFLAEQSGGGAWCESSAASISNCFVTANAASSEGGGVSGGTLSNCRLIGNSAVQGGGAYMAALNSCLVVSNTVIYSGGGAQSCALNNCTVVANLASSGQGGGIVLSTATNSILYYNSAPDGGNYFDECLGCVSPSFCCTTPLPFSGVGNITNEPVFVNAPRGEFHLQPASPCIDAGNNAAAMGTVDLDGNPRISGLAVDLGAYEFQFSGFPVIAVQPADQKAIPGSNVTFSVVARGTLPMAYQWQFNGVAIPNATDSSLPLKAVTTNQAGLYSVVVSNALGTVLSSAAGLILWPEGISYVWQNSPSPTAPYVSWATAAHNIQDAIDAGVPGLVVLVTNGTYAAGGRPAPGMTLTNRVVLDKPLTVKSVNGPQFTLIQGFQVPGAANGTSAVRCLYLTDGACLSGFTLTNGATSPSDLFDNRIAGAAWCQSTNSTITNCILIGNAGSAQAGAVYRGTLIDCALVENVARGDDGSGGSNAGGALMSTLVHCILNGNIAEGGLGWGGGVSGATLFECTLTNNSASYAGGAAFSSALYHCVVSGNSAQYGGAASSSQFYNSTITGNSAVGGGGVVNSSLLNCILYYNTSIDANANYDSLSSFRYSCTAPLPATCPGNISAEPQLASASHLSAVSPCRGAGLAGSAVGVDIDGDAWANPPSMGCAEYHPGAVTGPLNVFIAASVTNVAVGSTVSFTALIGGQASASVWNFGDGVIVSNRPYASHAWTAAGDYLVSLTAYNDSEPSGVSAAVTIHVPSKLLHYVAATGTNAVPPFTSWTTAATNIQDAVDAATAGDEILVADGLYASGGRAAGTNVLVNRVAVTNQLFLRSVNGPQFTTIQGAPASGGGNGNGAVRCVYLANGASLNGFTLTNGATGNASAQSGDQAGGGVWCESSGATLTNCVLMGNSGFYAGAAYRGTLYNCLLTANSATGNSYGGGGAFQSTLYNCTVSGNAANASAGGGVMAATLYNCIVYYNSGFESNYWASSLNYCCVTPMPTNGVGNITNEPLFANPGAGNFHLESSSFCIDAGNNAYVATVTDLDGNPRVDGGTADMGAYEFQAHGRPFIYRPPLSQTVYPGSNVTFAVAASGTLPMSWQWWFNGIAILDATNASLELPAVTTNQAGVYSVIVSNSLGTTSSAGATLVVFSGPGPTPQATHYVWQNSPSPAPPYSTWATAAHDISNAVAVLDSPGTIVVTNGVYAGGLWINKPLMVRSINGPELTIIDGGGVNQCVVLTSGATLSGFTLTNGETSNYGGAAEGQDQNSIFTNCIMTGSSALYGGGAFFGTLYNCSLRGNSARFGGGAWGCTLYNCSLLNNESTDTGGGSGGGTLYNCTLVGNSAAHFGGGVNGSTLFNCIAYFNTAPNGANYDTTSALDHCCTIPLPLGLNGNISLDPQLSDPSHLSALSPCRGAGSAAYAVGTDLDGEPWSNPPSIGCDELYPGAVTGPLSTTLAAAYTNVSTGFPVKLTSLIVGRANLNVWDFGDGTVVSNRIAATHAWNLPGDYEVSVTAFNDSDPGGAQARVSIHVVAQPVLYVSASSANPQPPYAGWATAATKIQDAVGFAQVAGTLVLVTNGLYAGDIQVNVPIVLRSVNGPRFTAIDGGGAARCVALTNDAVLDGFTVTTGMAITSPGGGGVFCGENACLTNCVITGNNGGGVYAGTLYGCTLTSNSAFTGGGALYSTLYNCTLSGNSVGGGEGGGAAYCVLSNCTLNANTATNGGAAISSVLGNCVLSGNTGFAAAAQSTLYNCAVVSNAVTGVSGSTLYNCSLTGNPSGGASFSTLYNCILYYNPVSGGVNYDIYCTLSYCCTTPMPTNGVGNITNEPALAGLWRLSSSSPCIARGSAAYSAGVDLDGEPWLNPPSIGCDEYYSGGLTGLCTVAVTASLTNVAAGFGIVFDGTISGRASASRWEFGDGTIESNRLHIAHQWLTPGDYAVVLRAYNNDYPAGVTATVTIRVVEVPVFYVDINSTQPIAPYNSWSTAAQHIQDAVVAASLPGSLILVTNGTYAEGVGASVALNFLSANGPQFTIIDGGGTNQCVSLADGASLSGFTLTNGFGAAGGGLGCNSTNSWVTNCVMAGNSAGVGGGTHGGTLYNCTLSNNSAQQTGGGADSAILYHCTLSGNATTFGGGAGGGAFNCTLNDCTLVGNRSPNGGGAYFGSLERCTLIGNQAQNSGGGAGGASLDNCLLSGNSAFAYGGGGASGCSLNNCTVVSNSAPSSVFAYGGGAYNCIVNNSIVYYNSDRDYSESFLNYCCTAVIPANSVGNITNAPLFVSPASGNNRLQTGSPCINAGNNSFVTSASDLDSNPRIVGGTVDIGAYEYQTSSSVISLAWLQQYGLPTDGSADFVDTDGDGMNNWQEWVCGTDPTNTLSVLRVVSAIHTSTNVMVTWQSVAGINYYLERCVNLGLPGFLLPTNMVVVATNVVGQAGTTTFTDTNNAAPWPVFYRVAVKAP